jgi:hypothetical protein
MQFYHRQRFANPTLSYGNKLNFSSGFPDCIYLKRVAGKKEKHIFNILFLCFQMKKETHGFEMNFSWQVRNK